MRKSILFLLLWVLPLQFVVAAIADAREHGVPGHLHEPLPQDHGFFAATAPTVVISVHDTIAQADAVIDLIDDDALRLHAECGACHFCHSLAPDNGQITALSLRVPRIAEPNRAQDARRSATLKRPERPNWFFLV